MRKRGRAVGRGGGMDGDRRLVAAAAAFDGGLALNPPQWAVQSRLQHIKYEHNKS